MQVRLLHEQVYPGSFMPELHACLAPIHLTLLTSAVSNWVCIRESYQPSSRNSCYPKPASRRTQGWLVYVVPGGSLHVKWAAGFSEIRTLPNLSLSCF